MFRFLLIVNNKRHFVWFCNSGIMHQDIEEILVSEDRLKQKIKQLGEQISRDYQGLNPLCIGILKGAVPFLSDLVRQIQIPIELDFMSVSSYGKSASSSGVVRILKDLDTSIIGRHVLVVEDIVDTGLTLSYLVELLQGRSPASVKTVVLLDKKSCRVVDFEADYRGFEVPDKFAVGYGMDYAERYRNLPYIGVLKKEVYNLS